MSLSLSYIYIISYFFIKIKLLIFTGIRREIRTPDPLVRSQVLCPAELGGHIKVAPQKGLEPLTYRVEAGCSIHLSYWGIKN